MVSILKAIGLGVFILFFRLIVTKDPYILSLIASGQYKEVLEQIKCRILSMYSS